MRPEPELISLCRRPVPGGVRARARVHLLDWLGIALASRQSPQAAFFEVFSGSPSGQLIPAALDTSLTRDAEAAFLLGGLGTILEMDDLHNAAILHTGNTVIPAALSTGRRVGASGREVLDAIARGYEAAIRIGVAAASGGYRPVMNSTACGAFGAAMAAADLLNLDQKRMSDALAQAGMMASGVWQCRLEPGFSKQVASANAARAGVEAARLAASGFAGPGAILSGPLGFFRAFYPEADPSQILSGPDSWKLEEVSFKPWPACRHTHPAIGAALDLARHLEGREVGSVVVRTYAAAIEFCDCPHPETQDAARFSLQHCVALALTRGAPRLADFEPSALSDPNLVALRNRIAIAEDATMSGAFPNRLAAEVSVTLSGETMTTRTDSPLGDPENPMSDRMLLGKFHDNASHAGLEPDDANAIVSAVLDIDDSANLDRLASCISAGFARNTRPRIAI